MDLRIKELRQRKGMTLEYLAEKSGYSPQYINRLEKGERRYNKDHLEIFSHILGCAESDLLINQPRHAVAIHFLVDETITDLLPEFYNFIDNMPLPVRNNKASFVTGKGKNVEDAAVKPRIELPDYITGDNIHVLIITDSRYFPAYTVGCEVFYCADEKLSGEAAAKLAGKTCLVQLPDGRAGLYGLMTGGAPGRYTLHPVGGGLLLDQEIEWAAPVLGTRNAAG